MSEEIYRGYKITQESKREYKFKNKGVINAKVAATYEIIAKATKVDSTTTGEEAYTSKGFGLAEDEAWKRAVGNIKNKIP